MIREGHEAHEGSERAFATIKLIPRDDVCAVVGEAGEVHPELGSRILEAVRQESLGTVSRERGIPFEARGSSVE
jgi:hypothetical protein